MESPGTRILNPRAVFNSSFSSRQPKRKPGVEIGSVNSHPENYPFLSQSAERERTARRPEMSVAPAAVHNAGSAGFGE